MIHPGTCDYVKYCAFDGVTYDWVGKAGPEKLSVCGQWSLEAAQANPPPLCFNKLSQEKPLAPGCTVKGEKPGDGTGQPVLSSLN